MMDVIKMMNKKMILGVLLILVAMGLTINFVAAENNNTPIVKKTHIENLHVYLYYCPFSDSEFGSVSGCLKDEDGNVIPKPTNRPFIQTIELHRDNGAVEDAIVGPGGAFHFMLRPEKPVWIEFKDYYDVESGVTYEGFKMRL